MIVYNIDNQSDNSIPGSIISNDNSDFFVKKYSQTGLKVIKNGAKCKCPHGVVYKES